MVCSKMFDTLYTLLLCWCGVLNLPRFYERKNQRYKWRVVFIHQILSKLKDACIYFSPECKEYMDKMKVIVVEDDDVNAYTTMGNAFVKISR